MITSSLLSSPPFLFENYLTSLLEKKDLSSKIYASAVRTDYRATNDGSFFNRVGSREVTLSHDGKERPVERVRRSNFGLKKFPRG
jgi:hypothetical protein